MRNENRIDSKIKEVKENIITVYVTNPDDVFKTYVESEGVRISNYSIVHRLEDSLGVILTQIKRNWTPY